MPATKEATQSPLSTTGAAADAATASLMVGQVPGQDEHMPSVEAGGTRQPGSM
jgi:hypothetical protein